MSRFEAELNEIVKAKIVPAIGRGDLVLIGGLAKLGKSSLATAIAAELAGHGMDATVLPLDRWILSSSDRRQSGVENRFDLKSALLTLSPWLKEHRSLSVKTPDYDRQTRTRCTDAADLVLAVDAVLIVEGVPALLLSVETDRRVHRIYVKGNEAGRRERVITDFIERGLDSHGTAEKIYCERQMDEAPRVAESEGRADFVITFE